MDSSNKDIAFDCNLLKESVANSCYCFAQLYQSSRWDPLRSVVVSAARFWSGVSFLWLRMAIEAAWLRCWGGLAFASRGQAWPSSQALTLLGGFRFITRSLGRPFLGEYRRARGIFGNAERAWATVQRKDPP